MTALWTSDDAIAATGGESPTSWEASGVSIDTRELQPGDLFVALTDQRDGHDFVAQALDKGAAAALVSRVPEGVGPDAPLLIVPDVLKALEDLGKAARERTKAKVVGITGSVGKTGTKEMLRAALTPQGKVHAAVRSFNNHWGVPLTLARMPADADFAVIEIGMNHPGEIAPLARMAKLDVAVITTVAAVHAEAFDGVGAIAREKAAIMDGLVPGGTAILNGDIATAPILQTAADEQVVKWFGTGDHDIQMISVKVTATGTAVEANLNGTPILFRIGAPGRHLAMNALAVLAATQALDADVAQAALALAQWNAPDGRGARHTIALSDAAGDALELIDEAYNANPTSMVAALAVLAASDPDGGRRIAFLGDMLELGPDELAHHASLAKASELDIIDMVHTAGPRMAALHEALPDHKRGRHFDDAKAMAAAVKRLLDSGDVAMVKGSLGSSVGQVVSAIRELGQKER
ncbi:MAG: UDP-N-acetylmuramoyl-tripeptide--D-alanyl-D-alanine ligase [Pseudomonadota bacterium]